MSNRSRLQDSVMRVAFALIGGALLVACESLSKLPAVEKVKSATLPSSNISSQPSLAQASQTEEENALEKIPLKKAFLERLKQVPNQKDREQYTGAIYELGRLSKKEPKNKAILETLIQNQEQLLPILQSCGYKRDDGSSSFESMALYSSNFWKLSNQKQLIQLVCGTGAYNRSFVLFIASKISGKTQFKPLPLTEFYKDKNGTIQRKEAAGTSGGRCLESPFELAGYYNEPTKNYVSGVNILVRCIAGLRESINCRMISLHYKNLLQTLIVILIKRVGVSMTPIKHSIHNSYGDRSLELLLYSYRPTHPTS